MIDIYHTNNDSKTYTTENGVVLTMKDMCDISREFDMQWITEMIKRYYSSTPVARSEVLTGFEQELFLDRMIDMFFMDYEEEEIIKQHVKKAYERVFNNTRLEYENMDENQAREEYGFGDNWQEEIEKRKKMF